CLAWYGDESNHEAVTYLTEKGYESNSEVSLDGGRAARTLLAELDRKDTQSSKCAGISWHVYDPKNPPEQGREFLVTDGARVDVGRLYNYGLPDEEPEQYWSIPDMSPIYSGKKITHYAEITLPVEDTQPKED